jgi:hypothetical protein
MRLGHVHEIHFEFFSKGISETVRARNTNLRRSKAQLRDAALSWRMRLILIGKVVFLPT